MFLYHLSPLLTIASAINSLPTAIHDANETKPFVSPFECSKTHINNSTTLCIPNEFTTQSHVLPTLT